VHLLLDVGPPPSIPPAHCGDGGHEAALTDPRRDRRRGDTNASGDLARGKQRLVLLAAFAVLVAHDVHASCGDRLIGGVLTKNIKARVDDEDDNHVNRA
jgi:hypothetical protein